MLRKNNHGSLETLSNKMIEKNGLNSYWLFKDLIGILIEYGIKHCLQQAHAGT